MSLPIMREILKSNLLKIAHSMKEAIVEAVCKYCKERKAGAREFPMESTIASINGFYNSFHTKSSVDAAAYSINDHLHQVHSLHQSEE